MRRALISLTVVATALIGFLAPGGMIGPAFAEYGAMSCTTGIWINGGGNFQINNRCNIDIVVLLRSGSGQCSGGCRHYLSVNDYHIYTIGGGYSWFSCASYETPVDLGDQYRCD